MALYETVDGIRKYLRVNDNEFDDDMVNAFIEGATAKIDRKTRRTWQGVQTSTNELFKGNGTTRLQLSHADVQSITALGINISPTGSTYTTITPSRVRIQSSQGVIELQPDAEIPYFPEYVNSVQITYDWGNRVVPDEIQRACRFLVAYDMKVDDSINEEFYEIMKAYEANQYIIV